jgi:hypothetical protein
VQKIMTGSAMVPMDGCRVGIKSQGFDQGLERFLKVEETLEGTRFSYSKAYEALADCTKPKTRSRSFRKG